MIYSVNFNEFKKRQKYAIKGLIIELYACKKVDKMTLISNNAKRREEIWRFRR